MGYYINPPEGTKEDFLKQYGTRTTADDAIKHNFKSDSLPVCLVDNGAFTAAGIAYDQLEAKAFARPDDDRPKKWYLISKKNLLPYLPARMKPILCNDEGCDHHGTPHVCISPSEGA